MKQVKGNFSSVGLILNFEFVSSSSWSAPSQADHRLAPTLYLKV